MSIGNQLPPDVTLSVCIDDIKRALDLCLDNHFTEAKAICMPLETRSIYHALGSSFLCLLESLLTFEREKFAVAANILENSIQVCERFKKQNSFKENVSNIFTKTNYSNYTEIEMHAELCYSECLLFRSVLTFMEDETLSSFIKAAMRMRTSFNTYKNCQNMLKNSIWTHWSSKNDFESGVYLGLGTFSIILHMLPAKVVKLLQFIGFSADKKEGLSYLRKGSEINGLRQIFCQTVLMAYNLIFVFTLTYYDGNITESERLLEKNLHQHPNGVMFLFFKARMELSRGHTQNAIDYYIKMSKAQIEWPQVNTFAYWDLIFIYALQSNWKKASEYAHSLLEISRWSKCIYSYEKAAIFIMAEENKMEVDSLMQQIPLLKQTIAGKHIPSEKFVIAKAERYFLQAQTLYLPMYEFLYVWNYFKMVDPESGKIIIKETEKKLAELDVPSPLTEFDNDNKALLFLIKGSILRNLKSYDLSLECLHKVLEMEKQIVSDTYIIPYTKAEIALVYTSKGNTQKAMEYLEDAKKHSGYNLENRLNFRIQSAICTLQGND